MTDLNSLPPEVLHLVLRHFYRRDLYQCSLVNKTLYSAAAPLLWQTCVITTITLPKIIKIVATSNQPLGRYIKRFYCNNHVPTDYQIKRLMKVIDTQLVELHIPKARHVSDQCLQQVASHWTNLTSLELQHSPITHRTIQALGEHCCQLNHIYLSECRNLSSDLFTALAHCPLSYVQLRYSVGHEYLKKEGTELFHKAFRRTAPLLINALTTLVDGVVPLWRNLTSLVMIGISGTHEQEAIVFFLQHHPALKVFELRQSRFTDLTLDAIGTHLPAIQRVIVSSSLGFTAPGLRRMVWHCRSLVMLSFKNCGMTLDEFPELVLTVNNNNTPPRANFSGLGRLKIDLIRQHSTSAGERKLW